MNVILYKLFSAVIEIVELLIIASIIMSFLRQMFPNLWKIAETIDSLVEPLLAPFRKIIPPLDLGGVGFDLTPLIVLILLRIVKAMVLPIILAIPF